MKHHFCKRGLSWSKKKPTTFAESYTRSKVWPNVTWRKQKDHTPCVELKIESVCVRCILIVTDWQVKIIVIILSDQMMSKTRKRNCSSRYVLDAVHKYVRTLATTCICRPSAIYQVSVVITEGGTYQSHFQSEFYRNILLSIFVDKTGAQLHYLTKLTSHCSHLYVSCCTTLNSRFDVPPGKDVPPS